MLLELVSIIINFILFSSSASLMRLRVGKPQWWPVFFLYRRREGLWDTNISLSFIKVGQE